MSPTTDSLLNAPSGEPVKNLPRIAEELKNVISGIFPESHLNVRCGTAIMDSVAVWFAVEPRDKWANGIFHNANYLTLHVSEAGRQRETGLGPYEVQCTTASLYMPGMPRFQPGSRVKGPIKKTGTPEQIIEHIRKYFTKLRQIYAPAPTAVIEDCLNEATDPVREITMSQWARRVDELGWKSLVFRADIGPVTRKEALDLCQANPGSTVVSVRSISSGGRVERGGSPKARYDVMIRPPLSA